MADINSIIKESGRSKKWIANKLNMSYGVFIAYTLGNRTMPVDLIKRVKKVI